MCGQGEGINHVFQADVQGTASTLSGTKFLQLLFGGKLAVPKQVGDLLKAAFSVQFLDRVATVQKRVGFAVDLVDGGIVHDDASEAFFDLCVSHAELLCCSPR